MKIRCCKCYRAFEQVLRNPDQIRLLVFMGKQLVGKCLHRIQRKRSQFLNVAENVLIAFFNHLGDRAGVRNSKYRQRKHTASPAEQCVALVNDKRALRLCQYIKLLRRQSSPRIVREKNQCVAQGTLFVFLRLIYHDRMKHHLCGHRWRIL